MSVSTPFRTFVVGKLVREGVLADIGQSGAKLWTSQPRKAALHRAIVAKFVEEWREAAGASASFNLRKSPNAGFVEELADVWEALVFTREILQVKPVAAVLEETVSGHPPFADILMLWQQLAAELHGLAAEDDDLQGRGKIEFLSSLTAYSLHQHAGAYGLTVRQIQQVNREKRQRKGRLINTRLEAVALSPSNSWIETFAAKFVEVEPNTLNPRAGNFGWTSPP